MSLSFMEFWTNSVAHSSGFPDENKIIWIWMAFNCCKSKALYLLPTDSTIWKCFLDKDFWPSCAYKEKIWFFNFFFMSDSFIFLQQITSTSDVEFNNSPISWTVWVRYSFSSCCFCNLISFSSLAFSTLSILYGRRCSLLFFYFLILPCLLYLAILTRFSISDPANHHFSYC